MRAVVASSAWRPALAVLLAAAAAVWSVATPRVPIAGRVAVPLSLTGQAILPVPWLFWAGMATYGMLTGWVLRQPLRRVVAAAALFGLPLHLALLLVEQQGELARGAMAVSSDLYRGYVDGVTAMGLAAMGAWSGLVCARLLRPAAPGPRPWRDVMALCVPATHALLLLQLVRSSAWPLALAGLLPWAACAGRRAGAMARGLTAWRASAYGWIRRPVLLACGVGVLALLARLFYAGRILADPQALQTGADGPWYDEMARHWAGGGALHDLPAVGSVGYVYFLGGMYRLFGAALSPVLIAQAVLGALACLVLFDLGRRLTTVPIAAAAAAAAALSFPLIFACVSVGHQALDVPLTLAVLWVAVRVCRGGSLLWAALGGALAGFGVAVREPSLLWAGFVPVWVSAARAGKAGWPRALAEAGLWAVLSLAVGAGLLAPLAGDGTDIYFNQRVRETLPLRDAAALAALDWNPLADPAGAWQTFWQQPARVAATLWQTAGTRLADLFLGQGYGRVDPIFLVRGSAFFLGAWTYGYLGLFAGGLIWLRRHPAGRAVTALLFGFLGLRILPHLVFESGYRYRAPLEPVLILLAVSGLLWSGRWLAARAGDADEAAG